MRDALRWAAGEALRVGKPLRQIIDEQRDGAFEGLNNSPTKGTWLNSTSEAGGGAGFQPGKDLYPEEHRRLWGALTDRYEAALAALELTESGDSRNDAAICAEMLASCRRIQRFRLDFTNLRACGA